MMSNAQITHRTGDQAGLFFNIKVSKLPLDKVSSDNLRELEKEVEEIDRQDTGINSINCVIS